MGREFDAFAGYPEPNEPRRVGPGLRTIHNRIAASYRDREFYDGARANGYGGMVNDGRWGWIAKGLIDHYRLEPLSYVLQVNSHKGFLLEELVKRGVQAYGHEPSAYAAEMSRVTTLCGLFTSMPYKDRFFDLVVAASAVYAGNLADAIKCLREIQRVTRKHAWVVLAAYEDENDIEGLMLLRYWFLTGTLILTKAEWREVMKHAGYTGDYRYDTAKSLKLTPLTEPT